MEASYKRKCRPKNSLTSYNFQIGKKSRIKWQIFFCTSIYYEICHAILLYKLLSGCDGNSILKYARCWLAVKQKTSRPHAEHRQKKTNSFLFLNRIRTACKQCSSNVYISVFNLRYRVDVLRHCNLIEFSD